MKHHASRCSVVRSAGPADRHLHRTGTRSSTVPSPASLMIDGLTTEPVPQSHQLGSRYRHGQRHVRRSSYQSREDACPIKSRSSLRKVAQLGVRDSASPGAKNLTPKQQLFAILSLLLQYMECGL